MPDLSMPDYRRNRVPGGTYFFTVNLLDRGRPCLSSTSTIFVGRCGACAS